MTGYSSNCGGGNKEIRKALWAAREVGLEGLNRRLGGPVWGKGEGLGAKKVMRTAG